MKTHFFFVYFTKKHFLQFKTYYYCAKTDSEYSQNTPIPISIFLLLSVDFYAQ